MPAAESGKLVTFGIVPDSPETGYGYIKKGQAAEHDTFQVADKSHVIVPFVADTKRLDATSDGVFWKIFEARRPPRIDGIERLESFAPCWRQPIEQETNASVCAIECRDDQCAAGCEQQVDRTQDDHHVRHS